MVLPLFPTDEEMHELTGFQRDLLYVIHGFDTPSGQAIKTELEEYYSQEINQGRLYPNLDALVTESFVQKGQQDRRTNFYTITEKGERLLRERRNWEDGYLAQIQ